METWAKVIIGDSRKMIEIADESVDLVLTSPPYWHIKDYGVSGQIGYGQTLHEYLKDLYRVWKEAYRVLKPGRRLCINVGDQFARSTIYGRYKIIPIHSEIIAQCESIGFDYMGSIIWQKKTTMNTTGGANLMGSYPYPPNGMIEIDYEFIMVFKKPGKVEGVPTEVKEKSKLTKEEWKEYFYGHWYFGGARQKEHEAMFLEELPKRLIKMYTFVGDIVLDPFLGSGTTIKVALELGRNAIGYEINEAFLDIIREKIRINGKLFYPGKVEVIKRKEPIVVDEIDYEPRIKEIEPRKDPKELRVKRKLYRVEKILDEQTLILNGGLIVRFLRVKIVDKSSVLEYLKDRVLRKKVYLRFDSNLSHSSENAVSAYVYLKNGIFINMYLIKSGMAVPDLFVEHELKDRFIKIWKERELSG